MEETWRVVAWVHAELMRQRRKWKEDVFSLSPLTETNHRRFSGSSIGTITIHQEDLLVEVLYSGTYI